MKLAEVLDDRHLKACLNKARRFTLDKVDGFVGCSGGYEGVRTLKEDSDIRFCFHGFGAYWRKLLHQHLLARLDRPHVCALADLYNAALEYLIVEDAQFEDGYERFAASIRASACDTRLSTPMPVARARSIPGERIPLLEGEDEDDLEISLIGSNAPVQTLQKPWMDEGVRILCAQVQGRFTKRAMRAVCKETQQVLSTLMKGFVLAANVRKPLNEVDHWETLLNRSFDCSPERIAVLRTAMRAYFAPLEQSNLLPARIRNAITLLVDADRRKTEAVSLALSVSAIESLLCTNPNHFAANAAVVIEAESQHRIEAQNVFADLYNRRSRVLHDGRMMGELYELEVARTLAGDVLRAVLQRAEFAQRAGFDSEKRSDLLKDIESAKYNARPLDGIEVSTVQHLWRQNAKL